MLVDKDRVKCGRYAVEHFGADTLILDDGLQYLHLQHRLDLVLIDRQAPFGNEYLLPRGTLREPPGNLRRASHIFITKSEGADNAALVERIRRYNRTAEIIECTHRPRYLQEVFTRQHQPLEVLKGAYVGGVQRASPRRSRSRPRCASSARASNCRGVSPITTASTNRKSARSPRAAAGATWP